jgi:ribonuclease T2
MEGDADAYFARSGALYRVLHFPDMKRLARRPGMTAGTLKRAIVTANPGLRVGMIRVRTTGKGWLEEIWLCLDKALAYRACPVNDSDTDNRRLRISPQK